MKIEIFSCSGGMAEGFRRAGLTFDVVVDKDPNAVASYLHNLGHRPLQMDATDFAQLVCSGWRPPQRVDLFVADPPCTPWSRAGKREGLADDRDQLRTTVDLIRALRPLCWLVANVPGLDDRPNLPHVHATIGTLASEYAIDFARLDAADYGVPQHRIRPFWFGRPHGTAPLSWPVPTHGDPAELGHAALGDTRAPWVTCRAALQHLPLEELGQPVRVKWKSESYAPSRLDEPGKTVPCSQPGNRGAVLSVGHRNHQLSDVDAPARTLTTNTHSDGALLAHPRHPISDPDAPSYTVTTKGDGRGAQGACVVGGWPWDRPAMTVTARDEIGQAHRNGRDGSSQSHNAIKLSERAAAILQGFPDGWRFAGTTKRARWSQIGQAMPPRWGQPSRARSRVGCPPIDRWPHD